MVTRGCIQRSHGLVFWQFLTALEMEEISTREADEQASA